MYKLLRKFRSLYEKIKRFFANARVHVNSIGNKSVTIGSRCDFGNRLRISATGGGNILIGDSVQISDNVQIIAYSGRVKIESGVFIGIGSIIVARENISIGEDSQIAEYVVIRDQDHRTDSSPIRSAGFHTSPIQIGKDVWIGCKSTILRGVNIGQHSVIAAHSVVKNDVPSGVLVAGIPARIIKKIS